MIRINGKQIKIMKIQNGSQGGKQDGDPNFD